MDKERAQAILKQIGAGGKLEVILNANSTGDGGGLGIDRYTFGSPPYSRPFYNSRPGESLLGRLVEINPEEDYFVIADSWCNGKPTPSKNRSTKVHYIDVHSIRRLVVGKFPRRRHPANGSD